MANRILDAVEHAADIAARGADLWRDRMRRDTAEGAVNLAAKHALMASKCLIAEIAIRKAYHEIKKGSD